MRILVYVVAEVVMDRDLCGRERGKERDRRALCVVVWRGELIDGELRAGRLTLANCRVRLVEAPP